MGILSSSTAHTRVCRPSLAAEAQDGADNAFLPARGNALGSNAEEERMDNAQKFSRLVDVDPMLDFAARGGFIAKVRR
jgi:hypothetical protein